MGVIHTTVAYCDERSPEVGECQESVDLGNTTQPFVALSKLGWSSVVADDAILTYCPDHPRGE